MGQTVGSLGLLGAALIIVGGCAATVPHGPSRGSASYEDAFRAAAQAVVAVGYQVKRSDANTGVIAAERVYRRTGFKTGYLYLYVSVAKGQDEPVVTAVLLNPEQELIFTSVDYDINVDCVKFAEALKKQLPDIEVERAE